VNDYDPTEPLRFKILRQEDDTLKHVADGVRWTDNSVSVQWLDESPRVLNFTTLDHASQVLGADGDTHFAFLDHWVPREKL
jgi:hypothetical protein